MRNLILKLYVKYYLSKTTILEKLHKKAKELDING
jgi:hypothetical protein